jgi:hypothetical protein
MCFIQAGGFVKDTPLLPSLPMVRLNFFQPKKRLITAINIMNPNMRCGLDHIRNQGSNQIMRTMELNKKETYCPRGQSLPTRPEKIHESIPLAEHVVCVRR